MGELFKGKSFLIVDDEPDLREILRDEFEHEGAQVTEAENGKKALEVVFSKNFDAVISDIRMPGGDGYTLACEIKQKNVSQPVVILITGFADVTSDQAYELGVEDFITKPFNLSPIRDSLKRNLQPRGERWAKKSSKVKTAHQVKLAQPLEKLLASGEVNLGRGGVFIKGSFGFIVEGDTAEFNLGFLTGCGTVRWVRMDGGRGLPTGIGIEFSDLSAESIHFVEHWIAEKNPSQFIPRK
jgi:CheY-like chemotaxis protein